jgi:hypothetical protein
MHRPKSIAWSEEKNLWLKSERGVCFEDIVQAIEAGDLLDDIPHPDTSRSHQRLLVVEINRYAYAVPYVEDGGIRFYKTIYPSRNYHRKYIGS